MTGRAWQRNMWHRINGAIMKIRDTNSKRDGSRIVLLEVRKNFSVEGEVASGEGEGAFPGRISNATTNVWVCDH